jgi:hypothetical protein
MSSCLHMYAGDSTHVQHAGTRDLSNHGCWRRPTRSGRRFPEIERLRRMGSRKLPTISALAPVVGSGAWESRSTEDQPPFRPGQGPPHLSYPYARVRGRRLMMPRSQEGSFRLQTRYLTTCVRSPELANAPVTGTRNAAMGSLTLYVCAMADMPVTNRERIRRKGSRLQLLESL